MSEDVKSFRDKIADAAVSNWEVERATIVAVERRRKEREVRAHETAMRLTQGNVRIQFGRYVTRAELDEELNAIVSRNEKSIERTR